MKVRTLKEAQKAMEDAFNYSFAQLNKKYKSKKGKEVNIVNPDGHIS